MTERARSAEPYFLSLPALLLFASLLIVPLLLVVALSVQTFNPATGTSGGFTFKSYVDVFLDSYYREVFLRTLLIGVATVVGCALIGAPQAYILSRMRSPWRSMILLLTLSPLLVSVVVRTLGWALLFVRNGVINQTLKSFGLATGPIPMLYTVQGVVIALIHVCVPFMIISVWASLQRLDPRVLRAALSLGANEWNVFTRVIFPQIMPGVLSGSLIVFAMSTSAFATPAIIGGRQLKVVATATYDEFLGTMNWPLGATIAIILLVVNCTIMLTYNGLVERYYSRHAK